MEIIQKSEKTPRLSAAGVFLFSGLMLAGLAGCSAIRYGDTTHSYGDTAYSVESPMSLRLTKDDENTECHSVCSPECHPEFISGSQTMPRQEIPKQVRDDRRMDSEPAFSDEMELNKFPSPSYVRDVPFYPGEEYQCGPSVLAGALNYLGYDIKPEDISEEIYLHGIKGALNIDMVSFARRFEDLTVLESRGDIIFLKENLSLGHPLIVFVDLGIWSIRKGHYMLIVGYDDSREGVIVYSGADRDKLIRYEDLMRIWKRGGYWTMRITGENPP